MQSTSDAENVAVTNSKIQAAGGSLIQVIGTASIVGTAVIRVMEGTSDARCVLCDRYSRWKALGPIMGIYNSISKFQSIKASSAQINDLMSMNDDKLTLEKSPPIRLFQGSIVGGRSGVSHRYTGAATGLTSLGFKIPPSAKSSYADRQAAERPRSFQSWLA